MSDEKDTPAAFYVELHDILKSVNKRRGQKDQVSFRKAVVEGLGLRDSFSSKIKDGTYRPTLERLANLAVLLDIKPTTFDSYVRRWAHEKVTTDDDFLELFRIIADQNESVQVLLKRGMKRYVTEVLDASRKYPRAAVA